MKRIKGNSLHLSVPAVTEFENVSIGDSIRALRNICKNEEDGKIIEFFDALIAVHQEGIIDDRDFLVAYGYFTVPSNVYETISNKILIEDGENTRYTCKQYIDVYIISRVRKAIIEYQEKQNNKRN